MSLPRKNVIKIVFAVLFTLALAFLAGFFTDTDTEWYMSLVKSPLMPPTAVFVAGWAVLFALFGASFALTLIKDGSPLPFMLMLTLLSLWCFVFFVKQQLLSGLILLTVILFLSFYIFRYSYDRSRIAGYFILPLCLWLSYAAAINYHTVLLN